MALVSAAEVRERSEGSALSSASATTTALTSLITRADGMMAAFCGYPRASATAERTMTSTTYTLYSGDGWLWTDPVNSRRLVIGLRPVTSITSIYEDDLESFGASTLVDSGDYSQRGEHGEIVYLSQTSTHGYWTRGERLIKATVVAGYSTAPETLKQAATELVLHLWELKARRGKTSINQGNLSTSYRSEGIPEHVQQILGEYLLPGSVA